MTDEAVEEAEDAEDAPEPDAALEADRVVAWRQRTLRRAGYDRASASVLAADPEVDLHRAVALLERGCPPELALDILL